MTDPASPRQQLLSIIAQQSFKLGDFTLSSGAKSDYYIDCRTTTLHAEGARLTARVFYDEIQRQGWKPQAIGGLTMGADPIAATVAMLSAQTIQTRVPAHIKGADLEEYYIHAFLVRKAEKAHGTGRRIEGFHKKGARVVIVDDVCTTGGSTIQAMEAAREYGFELAGIMCLVERQEFDGRAAIEKAAGTARFVSLFTANEVKAEHVRLFPNGSPR
jgi:orotate phosphoribosyltransferase